MVLDYLVVFNSSLDLHLSFAICFVEFSREKNSYKFILIDHHAR